MFHLEIIRLNRSSIHVPWRKIIEYFCNPDSNKTNQGIKILVFEYQPLSNSVAYFHKKLGYQIYIPITCKVNIKVKLFTEYWILLVLLLGKLL